MNPVNSLKIKIFSDGASKSDMCEMYSRDYIKGLTTNPTLMRNAGVKIYRDFCQDVLKIIRDKPISFEVFSDDFSEMERQAYEISSWGDNVYVKIPITNTLGDKSDQLIRRLTSNGIKVNVTAIMTLDQIKYVSDALNSSVPSYVSVFAGRIADTGLDPVDLIGESLEVLSVNSQSELIWASPREVFNIFQADKIGCHIITVSGDILQRLSLIGYDLNKYSLDTVKMFYQDALNAGYTL